MVGATSIMSTLRKRFFYPLIQAHPGCFGGRDNIGMQIRGNPNVEFPGEAFEGSNPAFLTCLQVNSKRGPAFAQQTFYIGSVKIRTPGKTQELPAKHGNIRVESNNSFMSINLHYVFHGVTPCCSSHLRTATTAPLSVSGRGWGRWYTRTCPNKNTSTREPSRSLISAPNSRNNDTISSQRIFPEAGREKINSRVRHETY